MNTRLDAVRVLRLFAFCLTIFLGSWDSEASAHVGYRLPRQNPPLFPFSPSTFIHHPPSGIHCILIPSTYLLSRSLLTLVPTLALVSGHWSRLDRLEPPPSRLTACIYRRAACTRTRHSLSLSQPWITGTSTTMLHPAHTTTSPTRTALL